MKSYPSIPKFKSGNIKLYTFDKCDGSNIRIQYSSKRGWYKFGTRTRLLDESDEIFGPAIPLFKETLAEPLEKIIVDQGWQEAIVFGEYYGSQSFAGLHEKDDPKQITIFDVNPYKRGMLSPQEFLKLFGQHGPRFLGLMNWTVGFVEQVRSGDIEGISFEGVVGKVIHNNKLTMYKAKTQAWINKVLLKFDKETADIIIRS